MEDMKAFKVPEAMEFNQDTPEPSVKFVSVLLDIFLGTRLGLCLDRTSLPSR